MFNVVSKTLLVSVVCLVACASFGHELRWDWSKINTDQVMFDNDFIFGTAVAEYQVSGSENCKHSNWARWDHAKDKHGVWRIKDGEKSGLACDFWHRYKEDIERLKAMKIKAFRFSVEWSEIEPAPGVINTQAIKHYHELMDALLEAGIEPVVTLHHFTHPLWFEDKGGFEHEENIKYFVDFCRLMMQEYGSKVSMWATFNEPGVYVFQGYIRGVWPPGKIGLNRATYVMKHVMQAHVQAYQAMKKVNMASVIGFTHSITQFEPYNDNAIERKVCWYINHLFHDAITSFFETGNLKVQIPLLADVDYTDKAATKSNDFIGIQYYSHVLLRVELDLKKCGQAYRPGEIKTDMPYCIYPEGLYRAIEDISKRIAKPQRIPIYITENGIADSDDSRRALFIKQYIYALHKAMQDGHDVRGYFYWSLLDNFEWSEGYCMKFGLYDVDMQTQKRTLRAGAQPFIDIVAKTYATTTPALLNNQIDYKQIAV